MTRRGDVTVIAVILVAAAVPVSSQVPLENEIRVNLNTASSQSEPQVVLDGDGAALVYWRDLGVPGGPQIKMRRFAPDGNSSGEITVASVPGGGFIYGAGASRGGDATLTYSFNYRTWAQRFQKNGELLGEPIAVNNPATFSYGVSDVAGAADGGFVVAMQSFEWPNPGVHSVIVTRAYSASGIAHTPLFQVSDDPARLQGSPKVGVEASGHFAVFWTSTNDASEDYRVHLRRYNASGVALGAPFDPTPTGGGDQFAWDIAMDPAGNFVVVWGKGPWADLWARLFGSDGQPKGAAFRVTQYEPSAQYNASVDMDSAGNFVVAWESGLQNGQIGEIYARLFRADGRPASDEFHVNQLSGAYEEELPKVALSDDGVVALTWANWYSGDGDAQASMMRRYLATCAPGATFLPLRGGRFLACVRWETTAGSIGSGIPVPWSDDSGSFWFFDAANLELFVKVLDGCGVNGHYWLYAAGLTDVGVDLALIDSWTGAVRSYARPRGVPFAPLQDVEAFADCDAQPTEAALARVGALPIEAPGTAPACRAR